MAVEINGLTGFTFNNNSVQDVGAVGTGGQTWQDVTASRAGGTTYTNSTGKPIQVNISGRSNSTTSFLTLFVNGVAVQQSYFFFNTGSQSNPSTLTAIVPAGSNYSVSVTNYILQIWAELR